MAPKLPTGSSSAAPGGKPRAQVAYEGDDEFSAMSVDPSRKNVLKARSQLTPLAPGEREEVKVDELKQTNEQAGIVGMLRRIFAK